MTTNLPDGLPQEYWINIFRAGRAFVSPFHIWSKERHAIEEIIALSRLSDYLETIHVTRGAGPNAPSIAHVYDLSTVAGNS